VVLHKTTQPISNYRRTKIIIKHKDILLKVQILIYSIVEGNSSTILTCFMVTVRTRISSLCEWISWGSTAFVPSYLLRERACLFCSVFNNLFSVVSSCNDNKLRTCSQ
jgi:hypothetical protein